MMRRVIEPSVHDLGSDNHRSPEGGILDFADAVLYNRAPLPKSEDVKFVRYYPNGFETLFHVAVVWTFGELRKRKIQQPCIAVLCRSNPFLAKLSTILGDSHVYNDRTFGPLEHDVLWDADLSAASAAVVGSIMEWPHQPERTALPNTLRLITHYYRLKNAEQPSKSAAEKVRRFGDSAAALESAAEPKIKAAKELRQAFHSGMTMTGNPVEDWKLARHVLERIKDLNELYREARMVRLFGARDALATGLAAAWISSGTYGGAASLVKRILDRERLVSSEHDVRGCTLMTIHKSKGKEFDAVVLVEGVYQSAFFDQGRESFPFEKSRRLLRVALTRARSIATIVRPQNAYPLVVES